MRAHFILADPLPELPPAPDEWDLLLALLREMLGPDSLIVWAIAYALTLLGWVLLPVRGMNAISAVGTALGTLLSRTTRGLALVTLLLQGLFVSLLLWTTLAFADVFQLPGRDYWLAGAAASAILAIAISWMLTESTALAATVLIVSLPAAVRGGAELIDLAPLAITTGLVGAIATALPPIVMRRIPARYVSR